MEIHNDHSIFMMYAGWQNYNTFEILCGNKVLDKLEGSHHMIITPALNWRGNSKAWLQEQLYFNSRKVVINQDRVQNMMVIERSIIDWWQSCKAGKHEK